MLISNGVGALHGRIPNQVPPTLHHARRPGHDGPRHRRQLRRPDLSPAQPLLWDTLSHPPPPWCQPRHETHYRRCPVWSSNATTAALCCTRRLPQDVAPLWGTLKPPAPRGARPRRNPLSQMPSLEFKRRHRRIMLHLEAVAGRCTSEVPQDVAGPEQPRSIFWWDWTIIREQKPGGSGLQTDLQIFSVILGNRPRLHAMSYVYDGGQMK